MTQIAEYQFRGGHADTADRHVAVREDAEDVEDMASATGREKLFDGVKSHGNVEVDFDLFFGLDVFFHVVKEVD